MTLPVEHHLAYVLRHGDDNLVLAQRLGEWVSRGPELEEDIALANLALDHLGVAQHLLEHAARLGGDGRSADGLAFGRTEREFANLLLVEQPNGDFGHTMARQFLFDTYQVLLWEALAASGDTQLGAIAARAVKEASYHLRHSSGWVIRLGDGTEESHRRMQAGVDAMWRFTAEMFTADDVDRVAAAAGAGIDPEHLASAWQGSVESVFAEAGLQVPADEFQRDGGRRGLHSEHLGHLLTEMQWMQRTYPGLSW